jgi:hypothetical protein
MQLNSMMALLEFIPSAGNTSIDGQSVVTVQRFFFSYCGVQILFSPSIDPVEIEGNILLCEFAVSFH